MNDKRKDPKPRVNIVVWQIYRWWEDSRKRRIAYELRLATIKAGKSNMDAGTEMDLAAALDIYKQEAELEKALIAAGESVGPIWDWVTSHKGLGNGLLAARLLAFIDYPGPIPGGRQDHCANISKLWRYLGLAVIDGKAESGNSHFCRKAKALLLGPQGVADQFIMHHAVGYREIYDDEKERLSNLHQPTCSDCHALAVEYKKRPLWRCPNGCKGKVNYTPSHIHNMAKRKMVKIFLAHLWLKWRELEGLPVTMPYIIGRDGHDTMILPPMVEAECV